MMQDEIAEVAYQAEICEANGAIEIFSAAPDDVSARHGLGAQTVGSAAVLKCGSAKDGALNDVLAVGIAQPATEQIVDEIIAIYKEAGTRFTVRLSPMSQPDLVPKWLEARGLALMARKPKMYRSADSPPIVATDLRVECIGPEFAGSFGEIMQVGTGSPAFVRPWLAATVGLAGWRHYLAFDGDLPVACGALFAGDSMGWLGMAATLPSHRRRGAQSAIIARRIRDAAEMGCRWVSTETSMDTLERPNPSYRNMLRTGFQLLYMRLDYSPTGLSRS